MEITGEKERTLELHEETHERVSEVPSCDCVHERMSDGLHHYLALPTVEELRGEPLVLNEHVREKPGHYVAIAVQSGGSFCFMRPRWAGHFHGESEAGEIAPATRLLCDWCKNHWSVLASVQFDGIN